MIKDYHDVIIFFGTKIKTMHCMRSASLIPCPSLDVFVHFDVCRLIGSPTQLSFFSCAYAFYHACHL